MLSSPFSCESATGLDVPRVPGNGVEREELGDLPCCHGALHVLLVGQNENRCILQVLRKTTCRRLAVVPKQKRWGKRKECLNDAQNNKEQNAQWVVNVLTHVAQNFVIIGLQWVRDLCRNEPAPFRSRRVTSTSNNGRFAFKLCSTQMVLHASCRSILCSSSLVMVRRSRSVLSTTRMTI